MADSSLSPYMRGDTELSPDQWKKVEGLVRRHEFEFELYLKHIKLI